MKSKSTIALGALTSLFTGVALAEEPSPAALVDALNGVFGRHAHMRASHAKGFCVSGEFIASGAGAKLSSAKHLQTNVVTPLIGRFSIGGGNPNAPDNARNLRGLALRFDITGGEQHDLLMISTPMFFARTPSEFVAFMAVRKPDPATGKPVKEKLDAFNAANPHTLRQSKYIAGQPVPASYATIPYWAVSTFYLENRAHKKTPIRWRAEPVAGSQGLSDEEAAARSKTFLVDELTNRLASGPVEFRLYAMLAQEGDNLIDPTEVWPATRKEVLVGNIRIKAQTAQACDSTTFIPTTLPTGILPSADPTLPVRAPSYAISLGRRLSDPK
ncbi:catalase family peroxidase [Chitinimonas sp. PSY-7]|uniref:catalase n=1 Tax=Chitinimonas sp. PSY-7 TaxID=3459088 RepID=UPI00403FEFB8